MRIDDDNIVDSLACRALDMGSDLGADLERNCWMIVHEYRHGVKPSEYDIREIDEDLYISVLERAKQNQLNS